MKPPVFALSILFLSILVASAADKDALETVYRTYTSVGPVLSEEFGGVQKLSSLGKVSVLGVPMHSYDLQKLLIPQGITFPPGSKALYIPEANAVLFRNTPANVSDFDSLFGDDPFPSPTGITTELTLVSFSTTKPHPLPANYGELRTLAGDSWKILNQMHIPSMSGTATVSSTLLGNASTTAATQKDPTVPEIPDSVLGSTCCSEIVVGPDAKTMDAMISYRVNAEGTDHRPVQIRFDGKLETSSGFTKILQLTLNAPNTPSYAVLLRVTSSSTPSFPLK